MTPAPSFLDTLKDFAENAGAAEEALRREFVERTKRLADDRAFAYRKYNLMRAVAEAVAVAEDEEIAVAAGNGILRTKLGWDSDSEARSETLSHFAPVSKEMFAVLGPADDEAPPPDVLAALRAFEDWYLQTHPQPFWVLFEHYMPETPLVDF